MLPDRVIGAVVGQQTHDRKTTGLTARCSTNCPRSQERVRGEGRHSIDLASAACTASFAATLAGAPSRLSTSSAGSAPLSSAEAIVAQPASVTWLQLPLKAPVVGLSSTPVVVGSAPAAAAGATSAARPSSPTGLPLRLRSTSAGSRRNAGARATSPASPMAAWVRVRLSSRGRAPRPRAAASAEAAVPPINTPKRAKLITAGSAPAPSPSTSRCTPSGPAAPENSMRLSSLSAGSTEPSVPSVVRSAAERPLLSQLSRFASRSSLQLRIPTLRHNAAAAS
eukprot:scaffold4600_cov74-Phaeocystis_antarctica.AAC.2